MYIVYYTMSNMSSGEQGPMTRNPLYGQFPMDT
jgi:hypothetical protein